jgi:hypothetical protein
MFWAFVYRVGGIEMATADQIRALVKSHSEGDDDRFYPVAMQVAANEARKGHAEFAADLRDLIDRVRARSAAPNGGSVPIPLATPQGELAELLAVSYPETRLVDMILADELRDRLQRILDEQRQMGLPQRCQARCGSITGRWPPKLPG